MITILKKRTLAVLAIASLGLSSAYAIPQVTMGTFDAGSGGNYRANANSDLDWVVSNYALGKSTDGTWFGTFCLEYNEHFANGGVYEVALNNGSMSGGVSGAIGGKDVISVGTAYLYEQFALGSLTGFSYGSSTAAKRLQNTIWYLEGERTLGQAQAGVGMGTFLTLVQGVANYSNDYAGSDVKVMNLTSNGGNTRNQDQLVYAKVADSGATLSILLLGLTGLIAARRKLARS